MRIDILYGITPLIFSVYYSKIRTFSGCRLNFQNDFFAKFIVLCSFFFLLLFVLGHRDKYLSSGLLGPHDHLHDHPHDHPLDHLHKHAHEHPHEHHPIQNPHALEPIAHHPHAVSHGWQQQQSPYLDIHEKTDAVQVDNKAEDAQRSMGTVPGTRNPYTYFDIATGEAVKGQEHPRRSVHISDIHSDHHHDDIHPDHHHDDIHPTTATFKDKRIAGVSYYAATLYILASSFSAMTLELIQYLRFV